MGGIDWTVVIVNAIATLPTLAAVLLAVRIKGAIRTPSGDPIGTVVERTEHISAADLAMTTAVHKQVQENGELRGSGAERRGDA